MEEAGLHRPPARGVDDALEVLCSGNEHSPCFSRNSVQHAYVSKYFGGPKLSRILWGKVHIALKAVKPLLTVSSSMRKSFGKCQRVNQPQPQNHQAHVAGLLIFPRATVKESVPLTLCNSPLHSGVLAYEVRCVSLNHARKRN